MKGVELRLTGVSNQNPVIADIAVAVTFECVDEDGHSHQIETELGYRRQDPYAATMTFATAEGALTWTVGRDLLARGVHEPTGEGDVHVFPGLGRRGQAITFIDLRSPDGELLLEARSEQLQRFLDQTYDLVPQDCEMEEIDFDLLIGQLLT